MNDLKDNESPQEPNTFDYLNQGKFRPISFFKNFGIYLFLRIAPDRDMNRIITTHLEASKIGSKIADQVFEMQRRVGDSSSGIPTNFVP